jgi:hypothetical protein
VARIWLGCGLVPAWFWLASGLLLARIWLGLDFERKWLRGWVLDGYLTFRRL